MIRRRPIVATFSPAPLSSARSSATAAPQATPKLNGTVGPGYTISL